MLFLILIRICLNFYFCNFFKIKSISPHFDSVWNVLIQFLHHFYYSSTALYSSCPYKKRNVICEPSRSIILPGRELLVVGWIKSNTHYVCLIYHSSIVACFVYLRLCSTTFMCIVHGFHHSSYNDYNFSQIIKFVNLSFEVNPKIFINTYVL